MPKAAVEPKKRDITVIERRLQSGNAWAVGSGAIPLVEPQRWMLRIANSEIRNGRVREMQHEKGWDFVETDDVAATPYEIGFRLQDGRLVRGTHGTEVLMKMERADYLAVQRLKEANNRKNTFGEKAIKETVLSAAEREPDGAEGADFLDRTINRMKIVDSKEVIRLED